MMRRLRSSGRETGRHLSTFRRASAIVAILVLVLAAACSSSDGRRVSPSNGPTGTLQPPTTSSPGATGVTPDGSVPPGFVVVDSSWIDGVTGWSLGTAPCAAAPCTSLVHTTDGARSWIGRTAPRAFLSGPTPGSVPISNIDCSTQPCVSHVRFADAQHGYSFGPSLFVTDDGGRSWSAEPSPRVTALETTQGRVLRVVTDTPGCPPACTYGVEKADVGATSWERLATPPLSGDDATLVLDGRRIYAAAFGGPARGVGDAHAHIVRSLDTGATWDAITDPCASGPEGEDDARALATAPGSFVSVLCEPRMGGASPFVVNSADAGATFGPRRPLPLPATNAGAELVSAGSPSVLAVSFAAGRSVGVLVSSDGGATWAPTLDVPAVDGPQVDWFLGFQDETSARASFAGGFTWTTHDGGSTWLQSGFNL